MGPTSGGSIGYQGMGDPVPGLVLLHLLLRSTLNTLRHGSMLCGIVVYFVIPPQDPTDLETVWDLLQEGP